MKSAVQFKNPNRNEHTNFVYRVNMNMLDYTKEQDADVILIEEDEKIPNLNPYFQNMKQHGVMPYLGQSLKAF